MLTSPESVKHVRNAGRAGALLPLASLWSAMDDRSARHLESDLFGAIRGEIRRRSTHGGWPSEEIKVRNVLSDCFGDAFLTKYLLDELNTLEKSERIRGPGAVNVLLASDSPLCGSVYGTAWKLSVTTTMWANQRVPFINFESEAERREVWDANQRANFAVDCLLRQCGARNATATISLSRWRRVAQLPSLSLSLRGRSLGLGIAVGVLSSMAEKPTPDGWAFTGAVDSDGAIGPVGGKKEKFTAALDKGLQKVVCPRDDGDEPIDEVMWQESGLTIVRVGSLQEAMERCAPEAVQTIISGIGALKVRDVTQTLESILEARSDDERRILVTVVANNDPFGQQPPRIPNADTLPRGTPTEEGAILAIAAAVRPDKVFLIHTTGPDTENDLGPRMAMVESILKERLRNPEAIVPVPLSAIELDDPTHFPQLMTAVSGALRQIRAKVMENFPTATIRYFVNATSGTPQMQAVLHLAQERGLVPDATLIQVRPSARLADGVSRLRVVEFPPIEDIDTNG